MMNKTLSLMAMTALAMLPGLYDSKATAAEGYPADYQAEADYVWSRVEASPDGQFDLSDDRQYEFLLTTLRAAKSDCADNPQVLRDLAKLRANHTRFGGPAPLLPANDDNPDGIIAPYNETTALFNLNDQRSKWGATALSSIPGGTEYSCAVLQIHLVGPGINEPVGEKSSVDLSCGVNFELTAYTHELTPEEVEGLDSGDFRLVPRLTYVYKKIDGPAKAGSGSLPPVTSSVPLRIEVDQPTQLAENKGKPYIKVCISRTQQGECDYSYNNSQKELILPLQGDITYNAEIADPTADGTKGFASIQAVNTSTGGACVEPHDIGSGFFTDPNTSWTDGGGTVLKWDIPQGNIGKIVGCANNGAKMDFVQVVTVQLTNSRGINYPVSTSITSEEKELAGPSVFKMPYLSTFSGCLAEDTQIALADGKGTLDIASEDLFQPDNPVVSQNTPQGRLWVQGSSIGMELRLSYKVTDDKGNSVIMTENHPIFAANPGKAAAWIFAKHLQVGAALTTLDGPSKVASIEKINYEKRVFNLFVANEDGTTVPQDQMNFYANNILVGDGAMQALMVQEEKGLNCQ